MALKIGKLFSLGGGGEGPTGLDLTSLDGRMKAIFAEILAAGQQRRITITVGEAEMVMDAGGKQLFRIISVKPATLRFSKATGIESRSYDNLDNQLIIITQLFAEMSGQSGAFDMVSRPVPTPYPSKLEGFSPDELRFAYTRYAPSPSVEAQVAAPAVAAPVTAQPVETPPVTLPTPQPIAAEPAPVPPPIAAPVVAAPVVAAVVPAGNMPTFPADNVPVETAALTPEINTKFFDILSSYCEITLLMNSSGELLKHTQDAPEWTALSNEIAEDTLRWVRNTSSLLPPKQLVVMRSQLSQSHSICFFADGDLITFAVINSVAIGRLFIAANEFFA